MESAIPRVAGLTVAPLLSVTVPNENVSVSPGFPPESSVVPPDAVNALDVSGRVIVVVIFDPPATVTAGLTMMVMVLRAVAPASSVTVTVS